MRGMLTRSQQWRRLMRKSDSSSSNRLDLFLKSMNETQRPHSGRIESAPELGGGDRRPGPASLQSRSMPAVDAAAAPSPPGRHRRVRFANVDKVVLVPTRQEYIHHKLANKLWWREEDYATFKRSAVLEVTAMINIYRIDAKTALERMSSDEYFADTDTEDIWKGGRHEAEDSPPDTPCEAPAVHPHTRTHTDLNALPVDQCPPPRPLMDMGANGTPSDLSIQPLHPLGYIVC